MKCNPYWNHLPFRINSNNNFMFSFCLRDWNHVPGFDEHRLFVGITWHLVVSQWLGATSCLPCSEILTKIKDIGDVGCSLRICSHHSFCHRHLSPTSLQTWEQVCPRFNPCRKYWEILQNTTPGIVPLNGIGWWGLSPVKSFCWKPELFRYSSLAEKY